MKRWLTGLAVCVWCAAAAAQNYRIVQSPTHKLDVWIDQVKSTALRDWCRKQITVRIVAHGEARAAALDTFMPRLGALLHSQCRTLQQIDWTLTDARNTPVAHGRARRTQRWQPNSAPSAPLHTLRLDSPPADRTPWQAFRLQDGCWLRTYWTAHSALPAQFIPAGDAAVCRQAHWLNGQVKTTALTDAPTPRTVTFVQGFPLLGLREGVAPDTLRIAAVNNERLALGDTAAPKSWLILPFMAAQRAWQSQGTLAVAVAPEMLNDNATLQARLATVRQAWAAKLAPGTPLHVVLIDTLRPDLRDPAAGVWRRTKAEGEP